MTLSLAIAMSLCPEPPAKRVSCVVDSDTIWLHGEKMRLAGIDAPELHSPKCPSERALAIAARDRLLALLQRPFVVWRGGYDRYKRRLVRITIDGRDVGSVLTREGLARPWSGRRLPWCAPARLVEVLARTSMGNYS